jgi:hypothetical protein
LYARDRSDPFLADVHRDRSLRGAGGAPFVLVALLLGRPAILYRVGDIGVRIGLFLSGIKFHVEGTNTFNGIARPSRGQPREQRRAADLYEAPAISFRSSDRLQG